MHAHLVLEGHLEEESEYEEWIGNASTWMHLGDKCALHHMFALATDLYGLAVMKDMEAFRKPMLWFRFAKACNRCGRSSDAQLAVKVLIELFTAATAAAVAACASHLHYSSLFNETSLSVYASV